MSRPSTRQGSLSGSTMSALNGGHELEVERNESPWDPEEVHQRAIFYAGSRVFLCPGKEVGNPDALTPQEGLGIPRNREARRELYKQKLEAERRQAARNKMSKKEREQEIKKSQDAMKLFVAQPENPKKKKQQLPDVNKKPKGLGNLLEKLSLEDPNVWEQCSQAGCTFWRNVETREIRVQKPHFKGLPDVATKDEPYALGTGSLLYSRDEFMETRSWLVQKGMPLPRLVQAGKRLPPTAEEIRERRRHYSARHIQRAGRKKISRQRAADEAQAAEERARTAKSAEAQAAAQALQAKLAGSGAGAAAPSSAASAASRGSAAEGEEGADEYEDEDEEYGDDDDYFDEESAEVNAGDA